MNPWDYQNQAAMSAEIQRQIAELNEKQKAANDPYLNWVRNFDPSQMPGRESAIDPATGQFKSGYELMAGADVAYDPNIASSPWMKMLLDQEGIQRGAQIDNASKLANAGQSQAFSSLATRGGVSAGARERIARGSARDLMMGRQDINRQGDLSRLGLLTTGMEKQAGLDMQNRAYKTDVDAKNIATRLADLTSANQYNLGKYQTQAQAWGADRTAQAQEKGK